MTVPLTVEGIFHDNISSGMRKVKGEVAGTSQSLDKLNQHTTTSSTKLGLLNRSSRDTTRSFSTLSAGSRGLHGAFGLVARGAGLAAGAAGIGGLIVAFKGVYTEAREAQKVGAQTNAVIKSTGGVAKISGKQVSDLATAISNKVGVDDEAIQSGANMLLTFKNIRNEAGRGNDIFNQTTSVVTDMTAALHGGDVSSEGLRKSSISVGKALNDPIKGITALTRVGVTFTDGQKKQIKSLVEHGDTLGAQKIILRELNSEFAGSAAAGSTATEKLGVVFDNIKEQVGTALLPVIDRVAGWLSGKLPGAVATAGAAFKKLGEYFAIVKGGFTEGDQGNTGFAGFLENIGEAAHTAIDGIKALIGAFKDGDVTSDGFVGAMENIGVQARNAFEFFKTDVLPILKNLAGFIVGTLIPAIADFGGWLIKNRSWLLPIVAGIAAMAAAVYLVVTALKVWAAITKIAAAVQLAFNIIMLANPFALIALAVIGLVTALVVAYKTSDKFRAIVDTAFRVVWGTIQAVWHWVKDNWPLLLGIITGPIGLAVVLVIKHWDTIKAAAVAVWDWLKKTWQQVTEFITKPIETAVGAIQTAWDNVLTAIEALWQGIKTVWQAGVRWIVDKFLGAVGAVLDGVTTMFGWVPEIGDKLKGASEKFRGFRDDINRALGGVKDRNVKVSATLQGLSASRAAAEFAAGGPVHGPGTATSDSIPAMLSTGEHVLTAREVQGFGGHGAVKAMRRQATRGYAQGGPVEFNIEPSLIGMTKFQKAIAAFNKRVDAAATKMALAGHFSANLAGVVNFAKAQAGKPYGWGSSGPGSYDCSGFVSNLVSVAKGLPLYRRLFSTANMRNYPWSNHFGGAFEVGWFTGNPGHTGATVNGVNMESRGGDGVVVGSRSRGANYTYFNQHAQLARGGPVLPGDPPFDVLDPRGRYYQPGLAAALQRAQRFDAGGLLLPGQAAVNVNGGRERVLNETQNRAWESGGPAMVGLLVRALEGMTLRLQDPLGRVVAGQLVVAAQRGPR